VAEAPAGMFIKTKIKAVELDNKTQEEPKHNYIEESNDSSEEQLQETEKQFDLLCHHWD